MAPKRGSQVWRIRREILVVHGAGPVALQLHCITSFAAFLLSVISFLESMALHAGLEIRFEVEVQQPAIK